ncbi:MAG: tRNA (adenosine(37)-N6)-dimethylallyltransferase MiaA [Candidatus Magasanikbacteria bacterium]
MKNNLPKVLIILGPTASGKTEWGIKIAQKYNGEVVSADSRQVYKGMDIGTAKPSGVKSSKLKVIKSGEQTRHNDGHIYIVEGIPHHLMDIIEPDEEFTLADFKKRAVVVIEDILKRGKLPIIVGGTGLYIQALVDNLDIPKVAPNLKLRADLEKKSLSELVEILKNIDSESAKKIDLHNPRRVLRALEVVLDSGGSFARQQKKGSVLYDALQIGIPLPREELYSRINARVDKQIADGLLEETKKLVKKFDWKLPGMSGIGYKQIGYFLRGEMSLSAAIEILKRDTRHYAKRQMTWFKRDKRINWLENYQQAEKLVEGFLRD